MSGLRDRSEWQETKIRCLQSRVDELEGAAEKRGEETAAYIEEVLNYADPPLDDDEREQLHDAREAAGELYEALEGAGCVYHNHSAKSGCSCVNCAAREPECDCPRCCLVDRYRDALP